MDFYCTFLQLLLTTSTLLARVMPHYQRVRVKNMSDSPFAYHMTLYSIYSGSKNLLTLLAFSSALYF